MEELLEALNHMEFHTMYVEEIFQGRKRNDFDNERIRAFIEVELLKDIRTYKEEHRKQSDKIRGEVYRLIYGMCRNSRLAECIADDYCLIYDGQVVGYEDIWFLKFIQCYEASVIPTGQL
ncbi:MAG: hypothetical protein IJZ53_04395 [Tyzzerella sp.]|nr:hypothetical protein [Tyzzerella sp.]